MLFHSPATQAYFGQELPLYVLLQDDGVEAVAPLFVRYQIGEHQGELRMLPIDGYHAQESYSLYAVTVPAAHMSAPTLNYRFVLGGRETFGNYSVPLQHFTDAEVCEGVLSALLPLSFPERYYLASGDLCLRVALLGCTDATLTLTVLGGETPILLPAEADELGEYVFVIPTAMLERRGNKLRFCITAQSGAYTVSLGTARSPIGIRLVDNAGPTVLRVSPAKGEVLEPGPAPVLDVEFFDGSGVNLRTSVFCLDGKNRSQEAVWSEGGVQYAPERPLSKGEHVIELTLRDRLGNRSYFRSDFLWEHAQAATVSRARKNACMPHVCC